MYVKDLWMDMRGQDLNIEEEVVQEEAPPCSRGGEPTTPSRRADSERSEQTLSQRMVSRLSRASHRADPFSSPHRMELVEDVRGMLRLVVMSAHFEVMFAVLIVANMVVLILEAQYNGLDMGHNLGLEGLSRPAAEQWPGASRAWVVLDMLFGSVFTLEVLIKLFILRTVFFKDCWNLFDTGVIIVWLITSLQILAAMPLPPMLLRVARMARLLRLLRLVRTMQHFDSLYLLTASCKASVAATFWTMLFLAVLESIFGISFTFLMDHYINDAANPLDKRTEIYEYFGTFTRSILTMFELAMGNWIPPTRAVTENVSEWYMPVLLMHKLVMGFAVIKVITGVFLHETFKVASMDDTIMMRTQQNAVQTYSKKMHTLFVHGDSSGDGYIDRAEFGEMMGRPEVRTWLCAMGLDIRDADIAFMLVQAEQGVLAPTKLSALQLVEGTARLKGNARAIDMALLSHRLEQMENQVRQLCESNLGSGTRTGLSAGVGAGARAQMGAGLKRTAP